MKIKLILFLLLIQFCKNEELTHTLKSKEEVLIETVRALENLDSKKIDSLLMTRKEHNEIFWKYVGERFTSDPNMSADLAYDFMDFETQQVKNLLLKELGGKKIKIESTKCNKTEKYGPFNLHLNCFIFISGLNGKIEAIDNIRSVIELNGKFKLYHLRK